MVSTISTKNLLASVALLSSLAVASPAPYYPFRGADPKDITFPLYRRSFDKTSLEASEGRALRDMAFVRARYGTLDKELAKRSAASVAMRNGQADAFYYIPLSVGTPAKTFQVIIDTGSADLWLSTAPCSSCLSTTPLYAPTSSSSALTSTTPFEIQYGLGDATGTLVSDTISLAGFTIANQTFAAVTDSSGVVSGEVSGIMGAGWKSLASSGATPFLQALAQNGALDEQIFSFAFTTFQTSQAALSKVEPGGIMSIGSANSSLYTGDLNWVPISDTGSYWLVPLQGISVQGTALSSSLGTDSGIAIDTGTTLIGGPPASVAAIYASIPGSKSISIQGQSGYHAYPCKTTVNVALTIGGVSYNILPESFNAGAADTSGSMCIGAFFDIATSANNPNWIVGDSFVKGLFTAYRFAPNPAVGFATLSSTATALGGQNAGSSGSGSTGGTGSPASKNSATAAATFALGLVILSSIFM